MKPLFQILFQKKPQNRTLIQGLWTVAIVVAKKAHCEKRSENHQDYLISIGLILVTI